LHGPVGVTTKFTDDVEPAWSVGIVQTTALLTGVLQLPEAAVALTNVTPLETEPLTKMPFARSGPWFVTVNVIVTWLPALTGLVEEKVGAVQVMQTFGAGTSSATNASLGPFSVVCSAFWVWKFAVEVVSPAK